MRLLLPAAVLLLALVLSAGKRPTQAKERGAPAGASSPSLLCSDTEAQEDTFMERLGRLREHVTSSATTLLEKGKAVVEDISNSKYAVESRYVCTHVATHVGSDVSEELSPIFLRYSQDLVAGTDGESGEQISGTEELNSQNPPICSVDQIKFFQQDFHVFLVEISKYPLYRFNLRCKVAFLKIRCFVVNSLPVLNTQRNRNPVSLLEQHKIK